MSRLFSTAADDGRRGTVVWFVLSVAYAALLAAWAIKDVAFQPYVAHADAFQHVYGLHRFLDPTLFTNDALTAYFADVAPRGYTALYWAFAQLGLAPLTVSQVIPVPLAVMTSALLFPLALRLFPVPAAAFLTVVLANQGLWMSSSLGSGTPRAFLYPIFTGFLLAVVTRTGWAIAATVVLMALFYPPFLLVMAALLAWRALRDPGGHLPGLALALAGLGAYSWQTGGHGPTLTASEARQMPELQPGGFREFFLSDPWRFWISDGRSGLLPAIERKPALWAAAALLPLVLARTDDWEPVRLLRERGVLLLQVAGVAIALYGLAHLLLFRLYLPARYTEHTLALVVPLAAGPGLVLLARWVSRAGGRRLATGLALALLVLVPLAPDFWTRFPLGFYQMGRAPELYRFVAAQPPDIRIASVSREADFLPTYARRAVLVNAMINPYHTGHYQQMRRRMAAQIEAHYTPSHAVLAAFLRDYDIDLVVLDRAAFSPFYLTNHTWVRQFEPAAREALAVLARGERPAMARLADRCAVFTTPEHLVLDGRRMLVELNALRPEPPRSE